MMMLLNMNNFQLLSCSRELANCCNDGSLSTIMRIFSRTLSLVQIIVPILLIIFASIEFFKLSTNPEKKNGTKHIIHMFEAAAIVFFIPVIMNAILNLLPQSFNLVACWEKAKTQTESSNIINTKYVPSENDKNKSSIIYNSKDYEEGIPDPEPITDIFNNSNTNSTITDNLSPASAKGILEGAKKVHSMYEQQGWHYYTNTNQLRWEDIRYSTNNPSKATCCATFVGSALYVGGVFSENEINKYNYNLPSDISQLCEDHGWKKITNYNQLAPGDIVLMTLPSGGSSPEHTQIYAGNGTWYNAGSDSAIQRENPYATDSSSRFLYAWRNN